jgi:hypothetical protein
LHSGTWVRTVARLEGERELNTKDKWTSQKGSDYRTTRTDTENSAQLTFLDDLIQTKLQMSRSCGTRKINERRLRYLVKNTCMEETS